jgi:hypothetical protein
VNRRKQEKKERALQREDAGHDDESGCPVVRWRMAASTKIIMNGKCRNAKLRNNPAETGALSCFTWERRASYPGHSSAIYPEAGKRIIDPRQTAAPSEVIPHNLD